MDEPYKGQFRFQAFGPDYGMVPMPEDGSPFPTGSKVLCTKTYISQFRPDEELGKKGKIYTVRAYLYERDYLSLEEAPGWVNASRFKLITGRTNA